MKKYLIIGLLLPIVLIISLSYLHQNQFTQPTLSEGILQLSEKDAVYQLKQGWTYVVKGNEASVHHLDMLPYTMDTNEVTTLQVRLRVPESRQVYSLNLDGIHQPYELWVNGQLIKTSSESVHLKRNHFYVESQTVDLRLVITPANERIAILQTPVFGHSDAIQAFNVNNFVVMLMAIACLIIFGLYMITLYFTRRHQAQYLYIGAYFLLISCTLLLSNNGIGTLFLTLPSDLIWKLKTVLGLCAVVPLHLFVTVVNKRVISKAVLNLLLGLIVITILLVFISPQEIYQRIELVIWVSLASMLLYHNSRMIANFFRDRLFDLKNILLISTLSYLAVYLILRIYYHVWGTDLQTSLWLVNFVISIWLYLALDRNQLERELESSQREAIASKISFFNAQIKPHFLYNAIGNIMALCYTDNVKAARLLGKFSTYLRLIFEKNMQSDQIVLEKELALIDAYVEIEKARFPSKINYHLEVDQQLMGVKIPPLSIEPFVENAIRHGLFSKEDAGNVSVSIRRQLDELVIVIQDNGVGMTSQTLDNLLQGADEKRGIGILNVVQRLRFIPNSHFDIQSAPHQGTVVTMRIPVQY